MKILDIFYKYGEGLLKTGNIFLMLLGMLIIAFCFILSIIAYVFKIGFRVFIIFLDETLYFAIKGNEYLAKTEGSIKSLLSLQWYYLLIFIEPLFSKVTVPTKPEVKLTVFFSIFSNLIVSLFNYIISIAIIVISVYWLFTYIEIVCKIGDFALSIFNTQFSLLTLLNSILTKIEAIIENRLSIKIFNLAFVWLVRLIGFTSIFWFRYYRLKKTETTVDLKMIFPFKSKFTNKFWTDQNSVTSKYKWLFSILFIAFIILIVIYFLYVDNQPQKVKTENEIEHINTLISNQSVDTTTKTKIEKVNDNLNVKTENKKPINKQNETLYTQEQVKFDKQTFNKNISNVIAQVNAEEFEFAIQVLDKTSSLSNIPTNLNKKIKEARAYLQANDREDALKILNSIKNQ